MDVDNSGRVVSVLLGSNLPLLTITSPQKRRYGEIFLRKSCPQIPDRHTPFLREVNHVGRRWRLYEPAAIPFPVASSRNRLRPSHGSSSTRSDFHPGFLLEDFENSGIILICQTPGFRRSIQPTDNLQRRKRKGKASGCFQDQVDIL